MIELLSPVGDFDCLKSAVQYGADAVYFGGNTFNARANATNFSKENIKKAIRYAKLRNVKVNFVLNILIKNNEFSQAIDLANYVYSLGADAIIVQDLGLATYLIRNYPDLPVHASTQMTIHNLDGVLELQKLGFKRIVLSRELSLNEISYICKNSKIEIETFIHGALCISYSGQCLFSSSIGARSGNRGKCAQPCRLQYDLISESKSLKNDTYLDKGYLLSPRDLCGLKYIPNLIQAGVKCLKIEGRMKSPTYVATITKIYRKYIDLAYSDKPYIIQKNDMLELMQAFNRGGFSDGNFDTKPNRQYVFKDKSNNMGLYSGNISRYNSKKGLITFKTLQSFEIGDKISVENEDTSYTVSELIKNGENIKKSIKGDTISIGRLKGNIGTGDKIYKIASSSIIKEIQNYINCENKKILLKAHIIIKKNQPIKLFIKSLDSKGGNYYSLSSEIESNTIPIDAIKYPISEERIVSQLSKTNNTPFEFTEVKVDLDENLYIPNISCINKLRRDCLDDLMNQAIIKFERKTKNMYINYRKSTTKSKCSKPKLSLLLNKLDLKYDYSKLSKVDETYIPFKYFINKKYTKTIKQIENNSNIFLFMPVIIRDNYKNIISHHISNILKSFNISGIVVSNIGVAEQLKKYCKKIEIVANFNFNIFNNYTIDELNNLKYSRVTLSPELDKNSLQEIAIRSTLSTELIVYGNLPIMNTNYCLLGSSNKCYPTCKSQCKISDCNFYLKDRLNMKFRIIPDNMQTFNTIYNSKITSINNTDIPVDYVIISVIDENIETLNNIIDHVKADKTFAGNDFTKGNYNKTV